MTVGPAASSDARARTLSRSLDAGRAQGAPSGSPPDASPTKEGAKATTKATQAAAADGFDGIGGAISRFAAWATGRASPPAGAAAAPPQATTQAAEQGPAQPLSTQLDAALPMERFDEPTQRERILDRAGAFEADVRAMTAAGTGPGTPLHALRETMGDRFAPDAPIELHGVASHFGPETLQAHVRDQEGQRHVFVRDGEGAWVEREDLARLADQGRIPSADPGMQRGPAGDAPSSATFGVARIDAEGRAAFEVPDVRGFDHAPRARPFQVGDTVQVPQQTGEAKTAEEGQPYVSDDRVAFGRIASTDGRGSWTVELTGEDGRPLLGDDGQPRTVQMTDSELREANNPTFVRDGSTIYDAGVDRNHPAQARMLDQWHASDAYRALAAERPGPDATPAERAAWERRAIDAADRFLDERMQYPANGDALRASLQTTTTAIGEAEAQLAALDSTKGAKAERASLTSRIADLRAQEASLREQLEPVERYEALVARDANIGEYFENGTGQCRHQAIAMQTLMQDLGIDGRMTRGAANTSEGAYRGEHMWIEATLSDGSHMLVDPTWSSDGGERPGPLEQPYRNDQRRIEDPGETVDDYRPHIASVPARDGDRIDGDELAGRIAVA